VLSEDSVVEIGRLCGLYPERKSAVLMILHVIFSQFGHIDRDAVQEAAKIANLPLIDLAQAASFYTMLPVEPVGRYHIQVCRTLSCYLRGSVELMEVLKEKLGIEVGQTTQDGLFTLSEVECLGSCGTAPVMQINDAYYENLTRAKTESILNDLRKRARDG
jgi:NADH-quinone oxidoreductase subunit E